MPNEKGKILTGMHIKPRPMVQVTNQILEMKWSDINKDQ